MRPEIPAEVIRDNGKRGVYESLVARFSRLYPLFITFFMLDASLILLKALIRGQSAVVIVCAITRSFRKSEVSGMNRKNNAV